MAAASSQSVRPAQSPPVIEYAEVIANEPLCRDHCRLTLRVRGFSQALPGQFVQLSPAPDVAADAPRAGDGVGMPLLPRAFSIGGLRAHGSGCDIDVIYRVVGVATHWMHRQRTGQRATVLGPLGSGFRIDAKKRTALLVIGGVGLPPLLYFAEALQRAGKRTVAFLGAQSADLVALELVPGFAPARDAIRAERCAREFDALGIPMVISTDDGSLGYRGTVVAALDAFARANPLDPADTQVYTCGPERMMRAAADWCLHRRVACQVCMERPMACGLGTCQSCIVTVSDLSRPAGWRYALCCHEGPVFDAERIVWDEPAP